MKSKIKSLIFLIFFCFSFAKANNYNWTGKGRLYDERNQYYVLCRLVFQERVKPFLGEDTVKCRYRCQDAKTLKDEFVITTHSDYACERQVVQPRGDKRDWRGR